MNFTQIAYRERRNGLIFAAMAEAETNPDFQDVLQQLAATEAKHFEFWRNLAGPGDYDVPQRTIRFYRTLRSVFGITFVVKLLEMQEDAMIDDLRHYLFEADHPAKAEIENVILVEEAGEQKLIKRIKEERVEFTGSIVLGLNDGLIELSGALTGFSFAFRHNPTVVLAGIILGISASLSMGSSAYLQARHERGKDPTKSALYVGLSYFLVLGFLIWPYAATSDLYLPLVAMVLSILLLVGGLSFYTAVIFGRKFRESFYEMLMFSIGTAIVTFLIGTAARRLFGIQI
jgi:VIT1/CCC1 family predicted Fe2+/Mn2+ transporter